MNVVIVYASKYGTVERFAGKLTEAFGEGSAAHNLRESKNVDISSYDVVFIGGSIYAGRIQNEVQQFCTRYQNELLEKHVGVFISCLYEGEAADRQLVASFPDWLYAHSFGSYIIGGEVRPSELRLLDSILMKTFLHVREDIVKRRPEVLTAMVEDARQLV
ncbi:MAG: flavodoxin domain-containing protein [Spirochaeta sp.]|nr:flavodoxin domain-containing protein [Spirochaeta sp.]